MRSLFFVFTLMSFVMYRASKSEASLNGTWDGSYRTLVKTMDMRIVFGPENEVHLYSNGINNKGKAIRTYAIKRNEIAITCKLPDRDSTIFIMKGRLSTNQNFVDGHWESTDNPDGNFYLAKALSK